MFQIAAVVGKVTGKYLFYKDYWEKYPDQNPFFKFFAAYIPFVAREKENTYKLIRWNKLRIAFGNFNELIVIIAATFETSDKIIESYLIRAYEMLLAVYGDHLSEGKIIPEKIAEFSRELELMVRVSATKDDLERLDYTVEERHGVTPASEEANRRTTIHSEQAAKVLDQFAVEMLDGSITKYRLFLTAAVRVKDAIHYDVIVDFSTYPHPPIFDFPQELHNILGDAGEALDTIKDWDLVHPPEWVEVIQELEDKVYKSETHLIEPIIEGSATPMKGKGFAKSLDVPYQKQPRGIPYPQDRPEAPKAPKTIPSAKDTLKKPRGIPYPQDKIPISKPKPFTATGTPQQKPKPAEKPVPFQASLKKEVSCSNCGFIFKSADEKTCQLCGSPRPT